MLDALRAAAYQHACATVRWLSVEPGVNERSAPEEHGARPAHPMELDDRMLGELIKARKHRGRDELGEDECRHAAGYVTPGHGV